MNKKLLLILEIVWIVLGTISLALAVRVTLTTGGSRIFILVLMAVISFLFAWFRHRQRKKS